MVRMWKYKNLQGKIQRHDFLGGEEGILVCWWGSKLPMKIDSSTGLQRMKGAGNVSRSGDRRLRTLSCLCGVSCFSLSQFFLDYSIN